MLTGDDNLKKLVTAAYLERIGYCGPLEQRADVLAELHHAHLLAVPFENHDIHDRRPIVLDRAAFHRKIVEERRGGFCYELNGLFAWLLHELGFRVTLLSAGVAREGGGFGPDFDHLTLRVDLEEPWLADVGFGECFRRPIPLRPGGDAEYTLGETEGMWTLLRAGVPQYRFTLAPRRLGEFDEMCRYHQTSPESSFTRERVATLATGDGRITLSGDRLIVTRNGSRTVRTLDPAECREVLTGIFGLPPRGQ